MRCLSLCPAAPLVLCKEKRRSERNPLSRWITLRIHEQCGDMWKSELVTPLSHMQNRKQNNDRVERRHRTGIRRFLFFADWTWIDKCPLLCSLCVSRGNPPTHPWARRSVLPLCCPQCSKSWQHISRLAIPMTPKRVSRCCPVSAPLSQVGRSDLAHTRQRRQTRIPSRSLWKIHKPVTLLSCNYRKTITS